MLDVLSDILTRLSLQGTLYFRTSLSEPWGITVPAYKNVARFHYVHRGDCLARVHPRNETITLEQGDLVVIPHGARHDLFCKATNPEEIFPLERIIELSGYDGTGALVYGGNATDREIQLICGHFSLAPHSRHVLLDQLPDHIHLKNYGEGSGQWLEASLRMIGSEAGGARLGGDLIALKLSEAIFAQAIRAHVEQQDGDQKPMAAFTDVSLVKALTAFHHQPAHDWSIEMLAREAGLSRTGFAQLFREKMGQTPIQYITSWRMQIARDNLSKGSMSIARIAELSGYSSEAAFSRVFKKQVGMPPSVYRTATHQAPVSGQA